MLQIIDTNKIFYEFSELYDKIESFIKELKYIINEDLDEVNVKK